MDIKFLKIDMRLVVSYGTEVAVFIAYLKFVERNFRKDGHGYFCFDSKYACTGLNMCRTKFKYIRNKAVEANLIEYIPGSNQNIKPRYKLLHN